MVSEIKAKKPLPTGLDTRAKLLKHQENTIRNYYSRVFKNESESLAQAGIHIKSSIGSGSRTKKKIGIKINTHKLTLKPKHNESTTYNSKVKVGGGDNEDGIKDNSTGHTSLDTTKLSQ